MATVLHVQVDDDVARRIDAVAGARATSRSALVRAMIASPGGLEEYERPSEVASCTYLPEGRLTMAFREYGPHNPRPEKLDGYPDADGAVRVLIDTVLYMMYSHYGARYREGSAVKRIRDRKREKDIAAGHDSPVPL